MFSGLTREMANEEPSGPAQQNLACSWQAAPSKVEPSAKISCALVDAKGKEIVGPKGQSWQIDSYASEVQVQRSEHEQHISLSFTGPSRDAVFAAIFDMQLTFRAAQPVALEVHGSGRDLIKGPSAGQKAVASCNKSFFDLMLIDEYGMATFSQLQSFPGCERLAKALINRNFPDEAVRSLTSNSQTLKASCAGPTLRLDSREPSQQTTHSTLSTGICQDLATFINAQGL